MKGVRCAKTTSRVVNKNRRSRYHLRGNNKRNRKRKQTVSENVQFERFGQIYENKGFKTISYGGQNVNLDFSLLKFNLLSLMDHCGKKCLHKISCNKVNKENFLSEINVNTVTKAELNVIFLWSAFIKKWELFDEVLKQGADITYSEPVYGFTALHLTAFNGCVEGTIFLCKKMNPNIIKKRYSPLHLAALMNNVDVAEILLDCGARINSLNYGPGYETPLYLAIMSNALDCVDLFVKRGATIYERGKLSDLSPLFLAIELGRTKCLKSILRYNREIIGMAKKQLDGNSALHLAASSDQFYCLQIILEHGGNPDIRNIKKETALHLAVKYNACCSVKILLEYMANPNLTDYRKRTPLHHAVESMTSSRRHIVKLLLVNGANVNATDEDGFSPLHTAALNRLPEYAALLVEHGADLTIKCRSQATAFGIMTSRTPSAIVALYTRLDCSLSEIPSREHLIHTEIEFDFRSSLHHPHEYELLNMFILEGRPEILLHPLCKAFLHVTWNRLRRCYYGMIYSWLRLSLFLCFYMSSAMAYQCQESKNTLYCKSNAHLNTFFVHYGPSLKVQWYILTYVCTWILYSKMYDFLIYPSLKDYLVSVSNQLEWISIAGVLIVSPLYTGDIQCWQLYVGAWAILSSWTNLMFIIGQLPVFGCYVKMFQKVQNTFYKILMTFAFFLIGYLACFCIFLPNSQAFIDISIGFTGILVLMVGDLNYAHLLNHKYLSYLSKISTYLICASFLIFVVIIVMNLLVGISIDDIDSLQENAELSKLVAQLKLCLYIERSYFNRSYIFKLLFKCLRMNPKPYIGQLNIKPLYPSECQLPKHIIEQAYNIIKNRKAELHCALQYTLSMNNSDECDILKDIDHQIEDNIKLYSVLRNDIYECKRILKNK